MDSINASPAFIVDEDGKRRSLIWATAAGETARNKRAGMRKDMAREFESLRARQIKQALMLSDVAGMTPQSPRSHHEIFARDGRQPRGVMPWSEVQ